jgi:hypothetical protein
MPQLHLGYGKLTYPMPPFRATTTFGLRKVDLSNVTIPNEAYTKVIFLMTLHIIGRKSASPFEEKLYKIKVI